MGKRSGVESQVLGQQEAKRLAELVKETEMELPGRWEGRWWGDALEAKPGLQGRGMVILFVLLWVRSDSINQSVIDRVHNK